MNVVEDGNARTVLPVLPTSPLTLRRGALFSHVMAGGGGFGDPLEREPERVLDDVLDGRLSREAALRDYAVVLDTHDDIDGEATRAARAARESVS